MNATITEEHFNKYSGDDKPVDHTPHSYEDVQDLEGEHHHYLQIIISEEDVTCTKDNIS
jgi:hypothetical protein